MNAGLSSHHIINSTALKMVRLVWKCVSSRVGRGWDACVPGPRVQASPGRCRVSLIRRRVGAWSRRRWTALYPARPRPDAGGIAPCQFPLSWTSNLTRITNRRSRYASPIAYTVRHERLTFDRGPWAQPSVLALALALALHIDRLGLLRLLSIYICICLAAGCSWLSRAPAMGPHVAL